ncbi:MAG TPA: CHAT domain-containing protein [Candidatus Eisenbacteria bacterium]|nr:CHAT domain-containing protein [Candidatus Eisenbacteria bacterium]
MTQGTARAFLLQFAEAKNLLVEAESLAKAQAPSLLGEIALRQGTLAFLQDDSKSAKTAYRRALVLSLHEHDPYLQAAALGSLGLIATRQEHYDESIEWNTQALQLSQSLQARTSVARILGNLGWSHFELGDFDGALSLYQQGEALSKESGLLNDEIYWMIGVATAHYAKGDYATAKKDLEHALGLARGIAEKTVLTQSLNELTTVNLALGDLASAEKNNDEALRIETAGVDSSGVLSSRLLQARILARKGDSLSAERLFESLAQDPKTSSRTRWEAEARLARVFDETNRPRQAEAHYLRAMATIGASRSAITQEEFRLSFLSSGVQFVDAYVDFLVAHHRPDEALEVADWSRSMDLQRSLTPGSAVPPLSQHHEDPRKIASSLHATFLFYWLGRDLSYLWAVTPHSSKCFTLPRQSDLDPAIKAYRQAILDGADVLASNTEQGEKLFAMLVAPAHAFLPRNSHIVLFPAEALYGLNFETLLVPDPAPHYWVEDVTLSTANSIRSLAEHGPPLHAGPTSSKSLLLIGNPQPAVAEFPQLQQAPAEIKNVEAHFPANEREVFQGTAATPGAYLSGHPERFQFLHFVTHGIASHSHPLESAVILSREGDTYKLYARDILAHPLRARLVTVSACNSAGTRIYAGEGLVGLSWAFLHAGAQNVISALWEVSDATSTPRLMQSLYSGLDDGEDPATALRQAKLSLLRSSNHTVFSKPFYWAPFQLYTGF